MGHKVYPDGSCRVYIRKLPAEVLNVYIITKIRNGEAPAVCVVLSEIPKQTLIRLVMDGYERSYVQCRSGRVAGSLIHTVMPARRKSLDNNSQKSTNLETVVKLDASDENIKQYFMEKKCRVIIENSPAIKQIFDNLPKLRKRKRPNYAELSMSPVNVSSKNEKHVPIYRQLPQNDKKEHTNLDLYEFDSDSENVRKKKRQKVRKSADVSVDFEKGMKDTMRAILKNFKKTQARPQRKNRSIKRNVAEPHKVPTSQHNVKRKAIQKQLLNGVELLDGAQHKINLPEIVSSVIVESNRVPTPNDLSNQDDHNSEILGFDNLKPTAENGETFNNPETAEANNNPEAINGLFDEDTVTESDLFGLGDESRASPQSMKDKTNADDIKKPSMETVDAFGFDTESTEPPSKTPIRINIISDIVIRPKLGAVSHEGFRRPNANSTMISTRRPSLLPSPWRPNLDIKRNPYLLRFKDTFLPNYNQEMVLDSTISDNICSDADKTPTRLSDTSKVHQTSILKYFNSSKRNNEAEVLKENSLFDDGDFSPIKSVTASDVEDKENLSPQKTSTALKKVKRDILGQGTASNRIPLSPLRNFTNRSKQEDIENYFGFDTIMEEIKENVSMKRNRPRMYFNKPVRLENVKQTVKNKVHLGGQPVSKESQEIEDDAVGKESSVENNSEQADDLPLRLFEDLDGEVPVRKYTPKRTKRQRQLSFTSEDTDDAIDHHRHKKKNVRTKEEEEEFNRWVTTFNLMCQTVNEYNLEIE